MKKEGNLFTFMLSSTPIKRAPITYVGYARVSTKAQAQNGVSLPEQHHLLESYAQQKGRQLISIHEDTRSAFADDGLKRPGLLKAIQECLATGSKLLVVRVDRLARNLSLLPHLLVPGLQIESVAEGSLTRHRLKLLIQSAQRESEEASSRQKRAIAQRSYAPPRNFRQTQQRGSQSNKIRAGKKVSALQYLILAHPEIRTMTWNERVIFLNTKGVLNLVSDKNGHFEPWTKGSLRKIYQKAVEGLVLSRTAELNSPASDSLSRQTPLPGPEAEREMPSLEASTTCTRPMPIHVQGHPAWPSSSTSAPLFAPEASATGNASNAHQEILSVSALDQKPCPLSETEKHRVMDIMAKRGMSRCDVLDELGLSRSNVSIWTSMHSGTKVSAETLGKLSRWLTAHASLPI